MNPYSPPCPGIPNLDDQTATSIADISAGSGDIQVTFGTRDGSFNNAGTVWIDWNQNEVFEPEEALGTWEGLTEPPVAYSFPFQVPSGFSGTTRARIMMMEVCFPVFGFFFFFLLSRPFLPSHHT